MSCHSWKGFIIETFLFSLFCTYFCSFFSGLAISPRRNRETVHAHEFMQPRIRSFGEKATAPNASWYVTSPLSKKQVRNWQQQLTQWKEGKNEIVVHLEIWILITDQSLNLETLSLKIKIRNQTYSTCVHYHKVQYYFITPNVNKFIFCQRLENRRWLRNFVIQFRRHSRKKIK